jgi:hypothetical protein
MNFARPAGIRRSRRVRRHFLFNRLARALTGSSLEVFLKTDLNHITSRGAEKFDDKTRDDPITVQQQKTG